MCDACGGDAGGSGSGSAAAACGDTTCLGGQACVADACVYAGCVGSMVPGDYATIQGAVNALGVAGGTVCLGAHAYAESIEFATAYDITLVGVSAAKTSIVGFTCSTEQVGAVTLKGLTTTATLNVDCPGTVSFIDDVLTSTGDALDISVVNRGALTVNVTSTKIVATTSGINAQDENPETYPLTLTIDGIDVQGSAAALVVNGATLVVRNSYIHDSPLGVQAMSSIVTLLDNTFFHDNNLALDYDEADTAAPQQSLTYFNNLFVDNNVALAIESRGPLPTTSFGNSLLWMNTTNYAGYALAGTDDVRADPLFTSATPPALGAGSPARGVGNASHAPATDYWGTTRGTSVDLGAVQSL